MSAACQGRTAATAWRCRRRISWIWWAASSPAPGRAAGGWRCGPIAAAVSASASTVATPPNCAAASPTASRRASVSKALQWLPSCSAAATTIAPTSATNRPSACRSAAAATAPNGWAATSSPPAPPSWPIAPPPAKTTTTSWGRRSRAGMCAPSTCGAAA